MGSTITSYCRDCKEIFSGLCGLFSPLVEVGCMGSLSGAASGALVALTTRCTTVSQGALTGALGLGVSVPTYFVADLLMPKALTDTARMVTHLGLGVLSSNTAVRMAGIDLDSWSAAILTATVPLGALVSTIVFIGFTSKDTDSNSANPPAQSPEG